MLNTNYQIKAKLRVVIINSVSKMNNFLHVCMLQNVTNIYLFTHAVIGKGLKLL